jgi:hypothetical protein
VLRQPETHSSRYQALPERSGRDAKGGRNGGRVDRARGEGTATAVMTSPVAVAYPPKLDAPQRPTRTRDECRRHGLGCAMLYQSVATGSLRRSRRAHRMG